MSRSTIHRATVFTLILLGGLIVYLVCFITQKREPSAVSVTRVSHLAPLRLMEVGPYGTNIRSSFTVDDLTITLKASRLYMKNSTTIGFKNSLLKKMVARDLEVKIGRAGAAILQLSKAYQEMPLDVNTFRIDHPEIQYPIGMAPPDRVLIEKDNKRVILWRGTKKEVWSLSS